MKNIITLIALAILPVSLFGQLDRSVRPKAGKAVDINIKDSEVFETANGITVILSENHKLPRVSFDLVMGSDPRLEGDQAGLSEIAGSLIMSGTEHRTKDKLDNEIDYIGASMRADHNSITMSCLTKHMDKGLDLMADVLMYPSFPQDEVDRVIKMNESNLISAKSDPGTMASNAEAVANFPANHPYGEIMTEETLANIDRQAIVSYYKKTFSPKGSYLVVVGDINKEQTKAIVEKYFSKWNGGNVYENELASGTPNNGNRVIFVKKPGAVQSVIYISFPLDIKPGDPDYLKLRVLNGILGSSGFGARLMQNLREDKAYTYGCYSRLNINDDGSWFSAGGNFRNEVTDSAITEILYEIERITDEYVTDDELALTKMSMNGAFSRSLERPSTVARFALSIIKNNLPKDYYQTYLKRLEAITKDDILEIAQKYFTPKNCNIVVVGSEDVLTKIEKFDADGNIEKLDAFGRPIKDLKPADITAEELLQNYIDAVTMTSSPKKLKKKMKKVKSKSEIVEFTNPQIPGAITSTSIWMAPNISGNRMELKSMNMELMVQYFDGEKGGSSSMQEGDKEMTEAEIAAEKKSTGLFPEMHYAETGMIVEMQGIETIDGSDYYLIKLNDGEKDIFEYYDTKTFLKKERKEIVVQEDQSFENVVTYDDYKETSGFLFPMTKNITAGNLSLSGTVKEITINSKVSIEDYK